MVKSVVDQPVCPIIQRGNPLRSLKTNAEFILVIRTMMRTVVVALLNLILLVVSGRLVVRSKSSTSPYYISMSCTKFKGQSSFQRCL